MSIFSLFSLLGGLAFFIYGMNQMSHSMELIAGEKMEVIINKLTSSRLLGLLLGCVITIALQSSSAVTVMLVGLVNSGILSFADTFGMIMGSHVGTTLTAWILTRPANRPAFPSYSALAARTFSSAAALFAQQ